MSILYLKPHKNVVIYVISPCHLSSQLLSVLLSVLLAVPSVETPAFAGAALPVAAVPRILLRLDVEIINVVHQVLKRVKQQVALATEKCPVFKC